ncbi:GH36-type glycosyl hydrolase domain-containing protein [Spirochaeta dissipatitropha]
MNCGFFDHINREYVITSPKTPTPWINYIGTRDFGGFIDQKGGGVICKGDPATNRIVKYVPQLPAADFNGETLYVRLNTADHTNTVFSPFYTPCLHSYSKYECRVGQGYSLFRSSFYDLDFEILVFVPLGGSEVIRKITVKNNSRNSCRVDLIPVVEYTHFDALKQFTNADWVPQTMQSDALSDAKGGVILRQYAYMKRGYAENYFTSNLPVSSYETDRSLFLGDSGYGTWANPQSLQETELNNSEARRGDNIAALMHHLGEIAPGESRTLITQLGQSTTIDAAKERITRFRKEENVHAAFTELRNYWDGFLNKFQIDVPDPAFASMVNVHNPHQCLITYYWSRYLSLYQLGLGARMMGFRDSSQDVMGIIAGAPELAKKLLNMLLQVQKRNGSAMHQFNPVTLIANEGDSREEEDRPKYYGDDHLWVVLAVCEYIKETADLDFLKAEIPFYEKDKSGTAIESGTVLEHLKRALDFTFGNTGSHGLPLLGFADWNDTVNLPEGAESVMIAGMYGKALTEMISLMDFLGDSQTAEEYRKRHSAMKETVNSIAWDGSWYRRYFDDKGQALGTAENTYGQIYTNAQSWTIIGGYADKQRAEQALNSVNEKLNTSNGIKLSTPGYDGYIPEIGGVTTFPPGAKENGGIFLHSNPWVIIAETMLGNGNRAFEYYAQINPAARNESIEQYEVEPYCYAQNILSDEHPQAGLGRNSWLSGTASWMYQAACKHILGIRPVYNGLEISPCVPGDWTNFKVHRNYRGIMLHILVHKPRGICSGETSIYCNGEALEGNILPAELITGLQRKGVREVDVHVSIAANQHN